MAPLAHLHLHLHLRTPPAGCRSNQTMNRGQQMPLSWTHSRLHPSPIAPQDLLLTLRGRGQVLQQPLCRPSRHSAWPQAPMGHRLHLQAQPRHALRLWLHLQLHPSIAPGDAMMPHANPGATTPSHSDVQPQSPPDGSRPPCPHVEVLLALVVEPLPPRLQVQPQWQRQRQPKRVLLVLMQNRRRQLHPWQRFVEMLCPLHR